MGGSVSGDIPRATKGSGMHGVFDLIAHERFRQEAKWGPQNHSPLFWLAILGEEFGEVSKEVVEWEAKGQKIGALITAAEVARKAYSDEVDDLDGQRDENLTALRVELVQLAAVAVAMLESLERNQDVRL